MGRWGVRLIGLALAALLLAAGLWARRNLRDACGDDRVLTAVHVVLRDRDHIDHIFINGVRTVSGSLLDGRYACRAEIADIRGNVDAAALPWREVRYTSLPHAPGAAPRVTVALASRVGLAPHDPRSVWDRVFPFWSTRN